MLVFTSDVLEASKRICGILRGSSAAFRLSHTLRHFFTVDTFSVSEGRTITRSAYTSREKTRPREIRWPTDTHTEMLLMSKIIVARPPSVPRANRKRSGRTLSRVGIFQLTLISYVAWCHVRVRGLVRSLKLPERVPTMSKHWRIHDNRSTSYRHTSRGRFVRPTEKETRRDMNIYIEMI